MFHRIVHRIALRRHFWRAADFSELAEVYTSMSIRSFGIGIIGIFVPVFLYKNGVNLQNIFYFYTIFFLLRPLATYSSSFLVGRIGPKHSIAASNILFIIFLLFLITFPTYNWPLVLLAFWFTIANGLFFLAYNTDFSKIKSVKNGGKELGWLYIFERVGSALGPVVGGLLATLVSPLATIGLAIVILMISLIPLFLTKEPVRINQQIIYRGFKWKNHIWDYVSMSAFNIENTATITMWPLLIGVFIFTDDTYAKLGAVFGFAMVVSMFSAWIFGKVIDGKKGKILVDYGTIINAITHIIRPFITAAGGAVAISIINEPTTLSYRMPLTKGYYDAADSEPGYRIVYFAVADLAISASKCLYFFIMYLFCFQSDSLSVLRYSFIFVGIVSLAMMLQKFKSLEV